MKENIVEAKKKGYYCDKEGNIFSVKKKIALRKSNQNRYWFCIRYYGKRVSIPVHRFVGYLKFGDESFKEGIEVRHLDNNSLNNSWDNIDIGTHSENMNDIPKQTKIKKVFCFDRTRFVHRYLYSSLFTIIILVRKSAWCEKFERGFE